MAAWTSRALLRSVSLRYLFRELMARPSSSLTVGKADHLEVHVEVADHTLDDLQLLVIFLSENGKMGLRRIEELGDHRGYPDKVAFPPEPAQMIRQVPHLYIGRIAFRVHFRRVGKEDHIGPFLSASSDRSRSKSRGIAGKVLFGAELDGIDKNAHYDDIGDLFSLSHEGEMSLVEASHGGHHRNSPPLPSEAFGHRLHFFDGSYYAHVS